MTMYDGTVVLLVDDSPTMRKIIHGCLEKLGKFIVIEAGDGLEAIEILDKNKIDLIISDWLMPRMDGLEFVRKVRESKKYGEVPILMITVNNYKRDVLAAMNTGVNGYLVKPYREEEFEQKIESILKYAE
jgi:two-component system, chemotaxis family, chemotaxis protein CheY